MLNYIYSQDSIPYSYLMMLFITGVEELGPGNKRQRGIGLGSSEGPISLDDFRSLQRSNTVSFFWMLSVFSNEIDFCVHGINNKRLFFHNNSIFYLHSCSGVAEAIGGSCQINRCLTE